LLIVGFDNTASVKDATLMDMDLLRWLLFIITQTRKWSTLLGEWVYIDAPTNHIAIPCSVSIIIRWVWLSPQVLHIWWLWLLYMRRVPLM